MSMWSMTMYVVTRLNLKPPYVVGLLNDDEEEGELIF